MESHPGLNEKDPLNDLSDLAMRCDAIVYDEFFNVYVIPRKNDPGVKRIEPKKVKVYLSRDQIRLLALSKPALPILIHALQSTTLELLEAKKKIIDLESRIALQCR